MGNKGSLNYVQRNMLETLLHRCPNFMVQDLDIRQNVASWFAISELYRFSQFFYVPGCEQTDHRGQRNTSAVVSFSLPKEKAMFQL